MTNSLVVGKLTANDATAQNELGTLRTEWSTTDSCLKTYKYVQAAADTTVANGTVLGYSDVLGHVASSDITDFSVNQPLGVGIGAITASYYGWVQVKGYHSAILTDGGGDITDGQSLIVDDTVDGTCDSVAVATAPTSKIIGVASADDVAVVNTVAGIISVY